MRRGPLPSDLVHEELWSEHRVHQILRIMACGGITVEIDGAGGLEDAAQFDRVWRHGGVLHSSGFRRGFCLMCRDIR